MSIWLPSERASAEREGQKIAVEIKTFLRPSFVRELEYALGQYILYRNLLSVTEPDRELYLAISERIYHNFFQQNASQFIVEQNQILLLVVDIQSEVIVQWIR
ncbi:MAG TPA: element excision factor XisH family protein [Oculatellaceae cyanobacterium]